jgi:REP element-mobilizing transposase RayT
MPTEPGKGHAALRRGRTSQTGSSYFLTLCSAGRGAGLHEVDVASRIWSEVDAMVTDGSWAMRCGVVLPDHVHLLVRLGERLSLSQCMQRLKAKTSAVLRTRGLSWERGYFDHHLRPDEPVLSLFLYIYLNPYRAGLVAPPEKWPQYRCEPEDWTWFSTQLERDLPPPEWLA